MEFDIKEDFLEKIKLLQDSAKNSPLELQLVWLCELLLVSTLIGALNGEYKIIITDSTAHWDYGRAHRMFCANNKPLASACSLLVKFRKEFVHGGYVIAITTLQKLIESNLSELLIISNKLGVPLNPKRTIYLNSDNKD